MPSKAANQTDIGGLSEVRQQNCTLDVCHPVQRNCLGLPMK